MGFWVDWDLWEKLSVALVVIFGFCVLTYNRWRIRRYAAIEARQKEEEAELYPMLKNDDIPFGARALERGVRVSGIWISSPEIPSSGSPQTPVIRSESPTPAPRPSPVLVQPANRPVPVPHVDPAPIPPTVPLYAHSPAINTQSNLITANNFRYEHYRPGEIYESTATSSAPVPPRTFNRRSDAFESHEKRASFHKRVVRMSQIFDQKRSRSGTSEQEELDLGSLGHEHDSSLQAEQHHPSRIHRLLRRRSSEEFRRKMSQIFNDRIHMNIPEERLQFDPSLQQNGRRKFRSSILSHFRSEA
ncbi:hypothetical protein N7454_003379 [Penicillium verhagenii]|nr:hypothetical protein N7454_003379 [Penicillium verhagenii]